MKTKYFMEDLDEFANLQEIIDEAKGWGAVDMTEVRIERCPHDLEFAYLAFERPATEEEILEHESARSRLDKERAARERVEYAKLKEKFKDG